MIKIRRGLELPISGAPQQSIGNGPSIRSVAVIGFDYHGMKPTMAVRVGDKVKTGQLLFEDKKTPGVRYTAPASGVVSAVNRGYQRALQSVVIDTDGDEYEVFQSYSPEQFATLERQSVVDNLVQSGLWTAIRTRPFSRVPAINSAPASIFVSLMDTHPLAADPQVVIAEQQAEFVSGLEILSRLTEGKVFVGHEASFQPLSTRVSSIECVAFSGVHPAGNVGTHIHHIQPASESRTVWTVGYQDVIAIAKLFTTGKLDSNRVVALAGPQVEKPRLMRTVVGANLQELTAGELKEGESRLISGSVFGGRSTQTATQYLGRYHVQVSVLKEGREREFIHYLNPGKDRFSVLNIYLSKLMPGKKFSFTTSTNGSERAMVPVGAYEKVMPLDILPTQLLRALIVGDTEMAQKLGCLELEEEDLALCTFVCPGKYEYGPILRDNLTRIEKEG